MPVFDLLVIQARANKAYSMCALHIVSRSRISVTPKDGSFYRRNAITVLVMGVAIVGLTVNALL